MLKEQHGDKGTDQNGLLWNVEELPLNPKQFPILNELYEF